MRLTQLTLPLSIALFVGCGSKASEDASTEDTGPIDADGDGVFQADDCDDEDPTSTIVAEDADCDGVVTASDCDDGDVSVGQCLDLLVIENGHTCAQRRNDTLTCWGLSSAPEGLQMTDVDLTVVGDTASGCGTTTDGDLQCWGDLISPTNTSAGFTEVDLDNNYGCAIDEDGDIAVWKARAATEEEGAAEILSVGEPLYNVSRTLGSCMAQLEDGRGVYFSSPPIETETSGTDLAHTLSSSFSAHACFIVDDGSIECEDVDSSPGSITSIVGAHEFVDIIGDPIRGILCGLDVVGDIHCYERLSSSPSTSLTGHELWGMAQPTFGGPTAAGSTPTGEIVSSQAARNTATLAPWQTFDVWQTYADFGCALEATGSLKCWSDYSGEHPEELPQTGVEAVSIGHGQHACTLDSSGRVACSEVPGVTLTLPSGDGFTQLSVGGIDTACALDDEGKPECWGLHAPTSLDDSYRFEHIHAHYRTACGLQDDGTAVCFTGALPPDTLPEKFSMVKAPGYGLTLDGTLSEQSLVDGLPTGPGHVDIDIFTMGASELWGCAVTSTGALECAGEASADLLNPSFDEVFVSVELSEEYGCALTEDGRSRCWGALVR